MAQASIYCSANLSARLDDRFHEHHQVAEGRASAFVRGLHLDEGVVETVAYVKRAAQEGVTL